jgi:hypothetical protein
MRWDYKRQAPDYAAFGNFNYGATGAVMQFTAGQLLRGAGFAAEVGSWLRKAGLNTGSAHSSQWGDFWKGYPYGHDPSDTPDILNGIVYAANGCKEPL